MNKTEFLERLGERLSGLPQEDIDERLGFYGEMIDDRMEENLSEEEAVAQIGSMDDIVSYTTVPQELRRLKTVLIGIELKVYIVKQSDDTPVFGLICKSELVGIPFHYGFDCQSMLNMKRILIVFLK